jgi:hypothetical protein
MTQSLIRALATRRSFATQPVATVYDPTRAISLVREGGGWVPSYKSRALAQTKKADVETGEDQKST